jgi:hypothetical protein
MQRRASPAQITVPDQSCTKRLGMPVVELLSQDKHAMRVQTKATASGNGRDRISPAAFDFRPGKCEGTNICSGSLLLLMCECRGNVKLPQVCARDDPGKSKMSFLNYPTHILCTHTIIVEIRPASPTAGFA